MTDAPEGRSHRVRWAVIVTLGRVVVEAGTADGACEKAERNGYIVLEVNPNRTFLGNPPKTQPTS